MNSFFFKITNEEQQEILKKHKELYNGYLSVQQKTEPTRVSVYNSITDNKGFTLKNSDLIKENTGGMCSECGGKMYEGECSECGSMNENWDTEDIDNSTKMDFIESDETIYEFEYDENESQDDIVEMFISESKKLLSKKQTKDTKVKKVANAEPAKINESVNNKLTEIKNFMTRISKY
jgi:hypothetical protein